MGDSYEETFAVSTCTAVIEGCVRVNGDKNKDTINFCWEDRYAESRQGQPQMVLFVLCTDGAV